MTLNNPSEETFIIPQEEKRRSTNKRKIQHLILKIFSAKPSPRGDKVENSHSKINSQTITDS